MDSDPRVPRLQHTALFGAASDETVGFVLAKANRVEVVAGDCFFRQGERGTSIFWLESGRVAILRNGDGTPVELRHLGPGECFGEVALFDFGPRSASVRAVEDCRALELTSSLMHELSQRDLEQFALLTMNMGRELARRLRAAEERIFRSEGGWGDDTPVPST